MKKSTLLIVILSVVLLLVCGCLVLVLLGGKFGRYALFCSHSIRYPQTVGKHRTGGKGKGYGGGYQSFHQITFTFSPIPPGLLLGRSKSKLYTGSATGRAKGLGLPAKK